MESDGEKKFWLSPASTDMMSASLFPNLTLTENSSYTFASTTSFCLDFYFEVMQKTPSGHIVTMLEAAWKENATLALKLMFQLRDVRRGKSAKVEFYHCLGWLLKNHPQTLIQNLEHLPLHGYWKDLLFLVQFSLNGNIELVTKKQVSQPKRDHLLDYANVTLEDVIRKRVDGEISKAAWKAYLARLSDEGVKKAAKELFQKLAKEIHAQHHLEAKARRKAKKRDVSTRISNALKDDTFAQMYNAVGRIFVNALKHDVEVLNKKEKLDSTALAGKWAPSIGGSFDRSTELGKRIARALYATVREKAVGESDELYDKKAFCSYQTKYLTPLRETIDIVERHMSKRKWSDINYERVPSVAMKRSKKIFLARDGERFAEFLEAVKKGEKKIASGALLPHEIVKEFMEGGHDEKELEDVAEMQWKSYVDNLKKIGSFESALAVCDVSGSMAGEPMLVAIALSLLITAVSKPPFNGLICSFSATPQLHEVNQPTLKEKVQFTRYMDWGANTNFQETFNLILNKAIAARLPRDEMVKTLFVFSDMEFDAAGGKKYETDYMLIERKFAEAGYPLPGIVFWNLRGGSRSKPVTKQQKNVAMVSGFSGQMLRTFLENGQFKSPYETMLETLGTHYDHLKVVD